MREEYLNLYKDFLKVRNLAPRTIKTYSSVVNKFLIWCDDAPEFVTDEQLLKFILTATASRSREQIIGALRYFYQGVLKTPKKFKFVPKVKREQFIPNILTKDEALLLIKSYSNLKHKAVISLVYYGALRISEAINLKIENIDKSGVVKIHNSKGAKDRMVPLTMECMQHLRNYYKKYHPEGYLFNGQQKETYSTRSIQNVLNAGLTNIGVTKHIRVHDLRHSRATHLLDAGMDIEMLRRFLGHKKTTTTQQYIHLSTASLQRAVLQAS